MLAANTPIREFMTPLVRCLDMENSLERARSVMENLQVRHIPVVDGETLVGVLSQRELAILESLAIADPKMVSVPDAMAESPYAVGPDTPIGDVVSEMRRNKYGCAVITENRKVIGIFTTIDALTVLERALSAAG